MMISIGIVAYNEGLSVYQALRSLIVASERCSEPVEIIVVASGCTDNTIAEARRALAHHNQHTLFVENERQGKAAALNKVAELASGEILVLCDADVRVDSQSIFSLSKAFMEDPELEVASAKVSVLRGPNKVLTKIGELSAQALDNYRQLPSGEGLWMVCGHLYAVKTIAWKDIPEYVVSDDVYIGLRSVSQGRKIRYVHEALVYIYYPQTWGDYFSQKLRNRFARRQLAEGNFQLKQPVRWLGLMLLRKIGVSAFKYLPVIILDCLVVAIAEIGWVFRFRQSPLWKMIRTSKQVHGLKDDNT